MKRKIAAITLSLTLAASLFGCGGAVDSSSETSDNAETSDDSELDTSSISIDEADLKDWEQEYAKTYDISGDEEQTWGYISQAFTDTFSQSVVEGLEAYTAKAFPNVTLNVGDGEMDVNKQVELAENFITQGVDVLMLAAADSDGCVVICQMAREAGVPFVVVNSDVNCDTEDHFFVGSDHYYSGQLQAEYLIDNVDDTETQKLCYLGGTNGFTHAKLRREGLYETLDAAGYNYEVLSDQEGEYLRDKGMEITEDWAINYGDEIDIIVAANDEMAMGALQALQAAGINDVVICGIDANVDAREAVKEGTFACTIFQDANSQGKWGAIAAYNVVSKGLDTEFLDIPYIQITSENIDEYLD